ncbi:MAG: LamG domain-containing protein, partial [Patescibacteria group bacterium]|nr:LamG domain-containing protein [Patescibacteria group bacterium]
MQLNANSPKFLMALLILAALSLVYTITATVPVNQTPTLSAVVPRTQLAQVSGSSCTAGDLACGLVGWWKLDEGSGTTASDSSGSGNTGTIQGNANWVSGAIGGAFSFDGATSMNIGTASSLDFTNAFTFSFWIKTGSVGTIQTIFTRGLPYSVPGKEQYDITLDQYSDPGTIALRYGNTTTIGSIETAYHSIPTGAWTHVAATYDGSQACLYVNGAQNVCKPFAGPLVDVGQAPVMGLSRTWYLNAAIDDFRAYDRALSASDIQSLYALGSGASSGTSQTSVSATPTPTPTPTSVTTTTTSGSGTTQTTGSGATTSGTTQTTTSGSIYISHSGTGSGSSCTDSRSLAWLNTASNWAASGAGLITPGTTVHICGTLTDTLHVRGSGAPGNPVTIHFEPNAAMSAPIWPSSWLGSNGAIIAMSVHDIVLDGGQNGLIEATQSGTGLQPASVGILMSAVSDVEVKGFTIRNMYVRTSSTDVAASGYGIALLGASTNVSLHDNRIYQMNTGIQLMYPEGALMSHIRMYRNTISDTNWCIGIGEQNVNALADDIQVYGNDLSGSGTEWDSPTDTYHHNGVHTFAVATGDSVTGLKIFDNYVHGDFGVDVTAMLFSEGAIVGA